MEKVKEENYHECELSNFHFAKYMSNSWNGFMIPFRTLQKIKLESITILVNDLNTPKAFYCKDWKPTTKKKEWTELKIVKKPYKNVNGIKRNIRELFFQDFILDYDLNVSILINNTNISFFQLLYHQRDMEDEYEKRNEHIEVMNGRAMDNTFQPYTSSEYYFIGSIKTSLCHKIYPILNKMNKFKDIFINF